jgi:hypothetical protein
MTARRRFEVRTGLARMLDVEHRSNRYVLAVSILGGLSTLIWRWATAAEDPWLWAFQVGAAMFLAWAIGRELDPDDTLSAGLAALVVVPLLALGTPSLASAAAMLIATRIAVRTTGISPHLIDGVVLTAFAAYLGSQEQAWPALGVLIVAIGTDRYAHPPGPVRTLWFAIGMALAALVTAIWLAGTSDWIQPTIPEWIVVGGAAVLAFLAIINTRPPVSTADYHPGELSESRLRFGRVLALFVLVVGIVYVGGPSVPDLTPLWAAVASVTVAHYYRLLGPGAASGQPPM